MDHKNISVDDGSSMQRNHLMPNHRNKTAISLMHMTFFWGKDVEILFPGFPNQNLFLYLLAVSLVFGLSVFVEVFSPRSVSNTTVDRNSPTAPAAAGLSGNERRESTSVAHTAIHMLRVSAGYLVMLSVMSFNIGIFLAATGGHTFGFFIIRRIEARRAKPIVNDGKRIYCACDTNPAAAAASASKD